MSIKNCFAAVGVKYLFLRYDAFRFSTAKPQTPFLIQITDITRAVPKGTVGIVNFRVFRCSIVVEITLADVWSGNGNFTDVADI